MELDIKKIKRMMAFRGWNQTDLAKEIGHSRQWLSYYFRHPDSLSFRTARKFSEVLGMEPRDLIK